MYPAFFQFWKFRIKYYVLPKAGGPSGSRAEQSPGESPAILHFTAPKKGQKAILFPVYDIQNTTNFT